MQKPSKITPIPAEQRTEKYWQRLNTIIDPEIGIGLVDLGLIYKISIDKKGLATVYMTLTSPMCPVGPVLVQQVQDEMRLQEKVKNVDVQIVWDPAWNQEMINPEIREMMFGL